MPDAARGAEAAPRLSRPEAERRRAAPPDARPATPWAVHPSGPSMDSSPWQDIVHPYPAEAGIKPSQDRREAEGPFGILHYSYFRSAIIGFFGSVVGEVAVNLRAGRALEGEEMHL